MQERMTLLVCDRFYRYRNEEEQQVCNEEYIYI